MARIRTVTPEDAEYLIRLNRFERLMRVMDIGLTDPQRVEAYAEAMKSGQWRRGEESDPVWLRSEMNRPGIQITSGIHRVTAVIAAGVPVDLSVSFNRTYWDHAEIYRQTEKYFEERLKDFLK